MKKFGPYLIFFAAMLWATDAPFRVHLTQDLPSSFIVLAEHCIDVLVVLPVLWLGRSYLKRLSGKSWLAIVIIAVGGSALASIAFTKAFTYVNPSVAILLQKLQPLIAIGLATSLLKEKLNKYFVIWTILALVGAYFISFSGFAPRLYAGEQLNPNLIGVGLALVAAILWGASTVLGKYALAETDFKVMTGLRFVLAFVFLLIFNVVGHTIPPLAHISRTDWLYFVIIALTSGVVSLFIYYKGLQYTKASIATLAELGFPLAAVIVNYFFLKAPLAPFQILGMALLLFAVFQLGRVNQRAPDAISAPVPQVS